MFKFFQDKAFLFLGPLVVYFLGWVYLTDYFQTLSVPRRDLGLTPVDVYLFAFSPFLSMAQDFSLWGWLFVIGLGVFGWAFATQKETDPLLRKLATLATLIVIVALTYLFGSERGVDDARERLQGCGGRRIWMEFKTEAKIDNDFLLQANDDLRLRLVWQTDGYLYVVPVAEPFACQSAEAYGAMIRTTGALPTYQINRADIRYVSLLDSRIGE